MMNDDFMQKLRTLHERLRTKHPEVKDQIVHILARSAKVSEEYGELMDEVLSSLGLQRQNKLDAYDRKNLEKEYADVLLATYLLGISLDIDIEKVVTARLKEKYDEHVGKI